MSRHRNTTKTVGLSPEETNIAIRQMMYAAEAHQRTSVWCSKNPDAKPPSIDFLYHMLVSFELILLSIEQSLRLLLLLHYSIVRPDTNHYPRVLYKTVLSQSGCKDTGIRHDIINKMDTLGQAEGVPPFSEKELLACLTKHDSSYSNFRYFQLDSQARLNPEFEIAPRDVQVVHCLALALIHLNMDEIEKRGVGIGRSLSRVPESEMTDELKALKERLVSR